MRHDSLSHTRLTSDATAPPPPAIEPGAGRTREPSLGELCSRLSAEMSALVGQEIRLARVELRESGTHLARDTPTMAMAASVAVAGALALTALLVLALGALGIAMPETRKDRELIGDARDRLVDRLREAAEGAGERIQHVMSRVVDEARSTAESVARQAGLTTA